MSPEELKKSYSLRNFGPSYPQRWKNSAQKAEINSDPRQKLLV